MSVKGLDKTLNNLDALSKRALPRATVQAINRVAARAVSQSVREVSRNTRVPRKLINKRARLTKATLRKPRATIRVNRRDLPAIQLGVASYRLSRRHGMGKGGAVLQIGRFKFPGAFIQRLGNGRWHVLQKLPDAKTATGRMETGLNIGRTKKGSYSIEVVKIPLAAPLTTAFNNNVKNIVESDMSKELAAALNNQVRLILKK